MTQRVSLSTFTELYQHTVTERQFLGIFLQGHLSIEFLLKKLIAQYDNNLTKLADDLNHSRLIDLNASIGTISDLQCQVLKTINKMRNKFAHDISFTPTIAELRTLWEAAGRAFSDLTDGISQGNEVIQKAESFSDLDEWEFPELFVQICYDLHGKYVDRGGDLEAFEISPTHTP